MTHNAVVHILCSISSTTTAIPQRTPPNQTCRFMRACVNRQKFDRIIIDTAPTGHTLRLLGFPDFLDNFLEKASGSLSRTTVVSGSALLLPPAAAASTITGAAYTAPLSVALSSMCTAIVFDIPCDKRLSLAPQCQGRTRDI